MTADYYPLLRKAIDGLDRPDEDARYQIYERARQALVRQLQTSGRPGHEVEAHVDALQRAVSRIERELADAAAPRAAPPAPPAYRHAPPEQAHEQPRSSRTSPARHRTFAAIAAVLVAVILGGIGAYYYTSRDRAPAQASRADTKRPAAPPAATPAIPTKVVPTSTAGAPADASHASYVLRRQRVFYRTTHPPGTIVVSLSQRFLYLVQPNQVAIRYAIGVGAECENMAGLFKVIEKVRQENADATGAPSAALKSDAGKRFGAPAVYFSAGRAVHGAIDPGSIGRSASSGCVQSWNEDIADFFDRVPLDERVVVTN